MFTIYLAFHSVLVRAKYGINTENSKPYFKQFLQRISGNLIALDNW